MSETEHKSRYAAKKESGNQMYGPGCCGHKITASQVAAAKAKVRTSDPRLIKDAILPASHINWSASEQE